MSLIKCILEVRSGDAITKPEVDMSDEQQKFLMLAVIEQKKYSEISKEMNIDQKTLSIWWNELKDHRVALSNLRRVWNKKCTETDFWAFKTWYESAEKRCHYCRISEGDIDDRIKANSIFTKRLSTRGRKLEIERIEPNANYDILTNLVFCCYWCNNAKTDEFTSEEFRPIGQLMEQIWANRLKLMSLRPQHIKT